ncbi:hypothetical protein LPJ66_001741 [Kickxella alabastrina]|uniref:Uncharacterized protein n=1 Tax=Kickxella alabastrina TaxID=61397 RepID=A0ACC1ISH0_9FUNG|nr:hypothetical protein LPJ66_001741 [Kickxella alabastrina]
MDKLAIFVPEHVDLDDIDKCLCDRFAEFIQVDSKSFGAETELRERNKFIVLERDCFLVYEQEADGPVAFHYQSRNLVMSLMQYRKISTKYYNVMSDLRQKDGLWSVDKLPVLYFVFKSDADCLKPNHCSDYNTVVEYYETEDEEDFSKFASIAKSKRACVPHFFVVNRGNVYHVVDTNDTSINYSFSNSLKYKIVEDLAKGTATIQTFIDEEKYLHERRPKTQRLPNFQLRDYLGNPVSENETFSLEIINKWRENKVGSDSDADNGSDEEDDMEFLGYFDYHSDETSHIFGCNSYPYKFGFKVVDGITYLTYESKYLCASGDDSYKIEVVPTIPPKNLRIQMHYAEDGGIMLTMWGGNAYANCDWVTSAYGEIGFDSSERNLRWGSPMKLRLRKIQK